MNDNFLLAALVGLGGPVLAFIAGAALPPARATLPGLAAAAAVLGAAGLLLGTPESQGVRILVLLFAAAIGLAAVVQLLRMLLPGGRPGWLYPAIAGLVLAGGIRAMTELVTG
ncbi:MAG: hypothetical protein IT545_11070 [Rhodobacteraceae bacterium]|nr:hypothetical protein [Paracoccaceae bacterium]